MIQRGQTVIEYILLISIVTMAVVAMGTDLKRGFQSVLKMTADQMGSQVNSDQDFTEKENGYLENSVSNSWQDRKQSKRETNQAITMIVNENMHTEEKSVTYQGKILQ